MSHCLLPVDINDNILITDMLYYYYYYNHTALWTVSGTNQVSQYQKGKTSLDLLKQDIMSGSDML